jgi:hypothetical protein
LIERHLADHGTVFDLDQQAVFDDAGIIHQYVDATEVGDDRIHRCDHRRLLGHVREVAARLHPGGAALRARRVKVGLIESNSAMLAPRVANSFAISRPIPLPPPVMITVLPAICMIPSLPCVRMCESSGL